MKQPPLRLSASQVLSNYKNFQMKRGMSDTPTIMPIIPRHTGSIFVTDVVTLVAIGLIISAVTTNEAGVSAKAGTTQAAVQAAEAKASFDFLRFSVILFNIKAPPLMKKVIVKRFKYKIYNINSRHNRY